MGKIAQRNMSTSHISKEEVLAAIDGWGKGLVSIAQAKLNGKDYVAQAKAVLDGGYGYGMGEVLFKPTLASAPRTFRTTYDSALSYFVGGNSAFPEDSGFALNPWKEAKFEIAGIITGPTQALIMGNKLLKKMDDSLVIANFSMGFVRDPKTGGLKIVLHHSSLPYVPAK
jgi:hypothetical protein